jgi:hypothetical protein
MRVGQPPAEPGAAELFVSAHPWLPVEEKEQEADYEGDC